MAVLLIISISTLSIATTQSELQDEINDLKNNISEAEDEIDDIEDQVDSAVAEINELNAEIMQKQDEIDQINDELSDLNSQISELEKQLEEEQAKYDAQYEAFKERMVAQYKMGSVSYLDVLLNSSSLSEFISRYYIIEKVADYDSKMLDQIEEQKTTIENSKKEVEEKKSEVSEKQAQVKVEEIYLSNKKSNKNKLVSQLNEEQKQLQEEIEENNEALTQKENELKAFAKTNSSTTGTGYVYTGGQLQWPCPTYTRISSGFGYRGSAATGGVGTSYHRGIDIASGQGNPIVAADEGTVIKTYTGCTHNYGSKCGCGGTLGNYIMISHGGGLVTLYGHCTSVDVGVGDNVTRGQQIGTVGSTGNSTGYHLHFAVIVNGSYVNPTSYLGM